MNKSLIINARSKSAPLSFVGYLKCLAAAALVFSLTCQTEAASKAWTGQSGGNWSTFNNWVPAGAPGAGDTLVFPKGIGLLGMAMTNDLSARTFNALIFADDGFTLRGNVVHLTAGIFATQATGGVSIYCDLALHSSASFYVYAPRTSLNLFGDIAGAYALSTGAGTLARLRLAGQIQVASLSKVNTPPYDNGGFLFLSGDNSSFTGPITVNEGILRIENALALGSAAAGTTVGGGATLDVYLPAVGNLAEPLALDGATLRGLNVSADWSGPITINGSGATFDCDPGMTLNIKGAVGGAGGVTKIGAGMLRLAAANTFSGQTFVNEGTLQIANATSLGGVAAGTRVYPAGSLQFSNALSVAEPLTLSGGDLSAQGACSDSATIVMETNSVINVLPSGMFTLTGALTGNGGLTKRGTGYLSFSGSALNTYAGETHVEEGTLQLGKSSGNAILGPLMIGTSNTPSASVTFMAASQLSQSIPITLYPFGSLNFNGYNHTVDSLTFHGGTVSGAGTMTLAGDITAYTVSNVQARIYSTLALPQTRAFNVVGHYSGLSNPELVTADLQISANISGPGGITKIGSGFLGLAASNSFAGEVDIQQGALRVENGYALGSTAAGTVVDGGALVLNLTGVPIYEPMHIKMNGGAAGLQGPLCSLLGGNEWAGPVILDVPVDIITYVANNSLTISGPISGAGGFTKWGFGTLILAGGPGTANSYAGTTVNQIGTLRLEKTIPNASIPGDLSIASYSNPQYPAIIELSGMEQIADGAAVRLSNPNNQGNGLNLNGVTERIGFLSGNGNVNLGTGTLTVGGDGVWTEEFAGVMSGSGGLTKSGTSALTLTLVNTFTGPTLVQGGRLIVNGSLKSSLVTMNSGTTLGGNGTVPDVQILGGTLSPGTSPGRLTCSNLTFNAASAFRVELNGRTPGPGNNGYDQLKFRKSDNLGGATLNASVGFVPSVGDSFVIVTNESPNPNVGTFASLPEGATIAVGPATLRINYNAGTSGKDVVLTTTAVSVEPLQIISIALVGTNLALTWKGGWPLYSVEKKTALSLTPDWQVVMPPAAVSNFSVPMNTPNGFYRIRCGQ